MTLGLTLLACLLALAAIVLEFTGVDAPVHRRAQKRASDIEDRADRISELEAALEDDYHDRAERMTMGRVPDVRKDMAPRFAMQKELAALKAEADRPEAWDRNSEGRSFVRRRTAVALGVLSGIVGFMAFLSGQHDQESSQAAAQAAVRLVASR